MPEKTLLAFADHGEVGDPLPIDGGDAEEVLKAFDEAGIDIDALAAKLQEDGARPSSSPGTSCSTRSRSKRPRQPEPMAAIRVIAVPYEIGRLRDGVGLGPELLLERGAGEALAAHGATVGITTVELDEPEDDEVDTSFTVLGRLAAEVASARAADEFPVVLSGSCLAAVGVAAGLGEPDPGVVWFDAHGDFNEPSTSVSGYLDGMGVAILVGDAWQGLAAQIPGFRPLPETAIAHVGGRAFDEPEVVRFEASRMRRVGVEELADGGLDRALAALEPEPSGTYLHLDLDVLDESVARVNRYSAAGGLTAEALEALVGDVLATGLVRAVSLTAYEPEVDPGGDVPPIANRILATVAASL